MRQDDLSMTQAAAGQDMQALPENAVRVAPGPGGTVVLPAGVELDDITVVGRDLVILLPDGTYMIVEGGALFVPTLVIGGVEVPPTNLAALLINDEDDVRPAAGDTPSSGGNFAVVVPGLGPAAPLGDLLPPTALDYAPPTFEDPGYFLDGEPDVVIDTPEEPVPVPNAGTVVDEGGLPPRGDKPGGSHQSDDSETTSGEIIVDSPDSPNPITDVTINGVPVTGEVGQQIPGQYGTLVVIGFEDGVIRYTYTLNDNVGQDVSEVFVIVVTDPDGDTATGTLTIDIVDDAPIAVDDVVTLAAGDADADGNVLTGEGSDAGSASGDTYGADGFGEWGIIDANGNAIVAGPDGIVIQGTYGTLTAGANGEWSYVRNADIDGTVTDVFTYFLRDGDGSQSEATLTLVSTDTSPTLTLPQPGSADAGTLVDEAGLPARDGESAGSEAASDSETTSGTIRYTDGDGVTSVSIDGTAVTSVGQTFASADGKGVLTITSIAGGAIGYSFTLLDNTSGDATSVGYAIVVTDSDGDTVSGNLVIDIVDDMPTANDDIVLGADVAENQPITVDVLANDVPGADGVADGDIAYVDGSLTGSGIVTYNGDGSFTYTPGAGESGTISFQYRITDGDGDSDVATVTIPLGTDSVPTISLSGDTIVDEAGLEGPPAGSDAASDSEFASGTISLGSGNDTIASLVINGVDVTNGGTVTGASGTLTVTGNPTAGYSYSYELTDTTFDGEGPETDDFTLVATDSDGDVVDADLVITIVDDLPTANDDIVLGADVVEGQPITVDVFSNDVPGADGVADGDIAYVDGSLTGSGIVTYNGDGSFTYTPGAGESGTISFQYRITDGDGDSDVATVTIPLGTDSVPTISLSGDTIVDEAGLEGPPAGSDAGSDSEFATGTISLGSGNDTIASLVINGVDVTNGGTVTGASGTLTVTGNPAAGYSYSYELTDNVFDGEGPETDDFTLVATDSDGDVVDADLVITIVDDLPTANDDIVLGAEVVEGRPIDVDVFANDVEGADGVALGDIAYVDGSLNGRGTVAYNGDGTFTYTPGAGEEGSISFQYRITDSDGDSDIATVVIQLGDDSIPTISLSGDTIVDEADLDGPPAGEAPGTNAAGNGEFAAGVINVGTGNDSVGSLVINGVDVTNGGTVTGASGTLTVTGNPTAGYSYSYELTDNTFDGAGPETDDFSVVLTDSDGDVARDDLVITILDDAPDAIDDYVANTALEEGEAVDIDVFANDVQGADGVALGDIAYVDGSLSGTGSVQYNGDGTFTYTPGANEEGTITFQYRITDGDGDSDVATVTIELARDSEPQITLGGDTTVDEAGLDGPPISDSPAPGSAAGGNSETAVGTIAIDTGFDSLASLVIDGVNVTNGGVVIGEHGTLTVTGNPSTGYSYSYVLTENTADGAGAETDVFNIVARDNDGDIAASDLVITIADDVPDARDDSVTNADLNPGETVDIDVFANDIQGADGVPLGNIAYVDGSLTGAGSVDYNGDGTFTYTPGANEEGTITFQYRITDGDGDSDVATVTINLTRDSEPMLVLGGETQVDEAGLDGPPNGAAPGSQAASDLEFADGTISVDTGTDTVSSLVINGVDVTNGGVVDSDVGTLTVSGNPTDGYTYRYELKTNVEDIDQGATPETDVFTVVLTDSDDDSTSQDLVISIVDDVPVARNDVDFLAASEFGPLVGNVIVDNDGDANVEGDTVGADGASVTAIDSNQTDNVATTDVDGNLVIQGEYGVLTIAPDGSYSYVRDAGTPGDVEDVFTYTLTDGDGDADTATLTITIGNAKPFLNTPDEGDAGTLVDEAGLPARGGEPAGSGEAADGDDTNNSDPSETSSVGTVTFGGGDGDLSVAINGEAVTGVGQQIDGDYGYITIQSYDPANGTLTYTYTLTDNTSGTDTVDTFDVVVTDEDGSVAEGSFDVAILDDGPVANDDYDMVAAGQFGPISGNVIVDNDGDALSEGDLVGADDASVTAVTSVNEDGNVATDVDGNLVIQGEYGVLTIAPDGSYSYTRDAGTPGGVTDTFNYVLTDGDGTTAEADLVISIGDDTPTLNTPEEGDAGTLVDEAGLPARGGEPAGSGEAADGDDTNNSDPSETSSVGTVTFGGGDGDLSVAINGEAVTGVGQQIDGDYGYITIQSYDPANGTLTYTYTLTDNTSGTDTVDTFEVVVTDEDGSLVEGSFDVAILDDGPVANDDYDMVAAGQFGPISGNVIVDNDGDALSEGDLVGADDASVTAVTSVNEDGNVATDVDGNLVIQGEYGVLTIAPDGSYSYTRDAGTPGGVTDTFNYVLTDGDGTTAEADLVISIGDSGVTVTIPAAGGDTTTVYEDALGPRNGEPAGTDEAGGGTNDDPGEVVSGSIGFTAKDGLGSISVAGTTIDLDGTFPQLVSQDAQGVLVVTGYSYDPETGTGTLGYRYTLLDNALVDAESTNVSFDVVVTDADGDSNGPSSLVITIVDDAPEANDDGSQANPIAVGEDAATQIDAFANDLFGADDVDTVSDVSFSQPSNGTVTYDSATGLFTYTPNTGYSGPDSFTYTIEDGDGDVDTATVYLDVAADSRPVAGAAGDLTVDEDSLPDGNTDIGQLDPREVAETSVTTDQVTVDFGGDVPANPTDNFTFLADGLNGQLTSGGDPVTFTVNSAGQLVGTAGGDPVILIQLTGATVSGSNVTYTYSVTLQGPIDHDFGDQTEGLEFLSGVQFQVTDSDGDMLTDGSGNPAPGSFDVEIRDDVPQAFTPTAAEITNAAGPESSPIALNFGGSAGADGIGDIVFDVADGTLLKDDAGNQLKLNGDDLRLYNTVSIDGDPQLVARTDDGEIGFYITLDPETDSYTIDVENPIFNISQTSFKDVSGVGGGNVGAKALGTDTAQPQDILIFGSSGGSGQNTVNTNNSEIGIGSGNNVNDTDVIRFELQSNIVPPANSGDPFTSDGFYDVQTYDQKIEFVQGGGTTGFTISIYDDSNPNNRVLNDGTATSDVTVYVYDGDPALSSSNIVATFTNNGGNSIAVTGVTAGQWIRVESSDDFNAVQYSNQTGRPFKLGAINIESANTLEEFDFSIPIKGVDGDGDEVDATIDVTLTPSSTAGAANDNLLMAEVEMQQSLMMASAMAIGFGFAMHDMAAFAIGSESGFDSFAGMIDLGGNQGFALEPVRIDALRMDEGSLLDGNAVVSVDPALSSHMVEKVSFDADLADHAAAAPEAAPYQAASEAVAAAPMPDFGGDIAMPGAEALAMMAAANQGSVDLSKIGADALVALPEGNIVEAALDALGGDAMDAVAVIQPANDVVPFWDSGMQGGFTADMAVNMSAEAMMLQPDAAHPMMNG
ncbi:Ig-like domain-containing protein [Sphingomicrobium sp. XHP0235]|uniref:Ig-like domain-containing protein n=1 Tax=Sphingomicrobium aquimarinum TaxID=3133971 RepID=UPI0031FF1FA0